jgi:lipopolysaccharide export system ATP-binding protein
VLATQDICKAFRGRQVVEDVSLFVQRGEAVGVLGPSGAGKTTIFSMLVGVAPPDRGRIFLDGKDVTRMHQFERARRGLSYLPQEPSIFKGLTVEQNILLVLESHVADRKRRRARLEWLLTQFSIEPLRNASAARLSGGERRRCEIARALASDPSFILLDEPFTGIDPIAVGDIRAIVRFLTGHGLGVLITDHNVHETLGMVDRAYIIESGRVLMQGTVDAVVADPMVRRAYLGADFRL